LRRRRTFVDLLTAFLAVVSLVSEWTVGIRPAHMTETFGYQQPACWLAVAGLAAALILEARAAVIALVATEAVLAAWFAWASWIVTTPAFTRLPFPFLPTDIVGSGFDTAAAALLVASGWVVWNMRNLRRVRGADLWLATALPGFGLMLLGRWGRGATLTVLTAGAFYFASSDSPDSTIFADYGRFGAVPPAYPRAAGWLLLATAAALYVLAIALTVWERRKLQKEMNSS